MLSSLTEKNAPIHSLPVQIYEHSVQYQQYCSEFCEERVSTIIGLDYWTQPNCHKTLLIQRRMETKHSYSFTVLTTEWFTLVVKLKRQCMVVRVLHTLVNVYDNPGPDHLIDSHWSICNVTTTAYIKVVMEIQILMTLMIAFVSLPVRCLFSV